MKEATRLSRPALEPIIPDLIRKTKANYNCKNIRLNTGRFAKKIMEDEGHKVVTQKRFL